MDKLGNIKDAINRAAELAEIDSFVTYYPSEELNWKQQLLSSIFSISGGIIPQSVLENFFVKSSLKTLSEIESFNDPKGIYLKCERLLDLSDKSSRTKEGDNFFFFSKEKSSSSERSFNRSDRLREV